MKLRIREAKAAAIFHRPLVLFGQCRSRAPVLPPEARDSTYYTGGMQFRVVLEFDPEAGSYSAVCPELPGCASAGDTEDEARRNIEEAIRLYLAPADIHMPDSAKMIEVTVG